MRCVYVEILFQRAELKDASELIAVQDLSFKEDFEKYGECPAYHEPYENMLDMIKNAIVYKIISAGRIIGDIIVRKKENGSYYLRVISIIPEFQDLGIGTQAIEFIEKDNPGANFWFLITPAGNRRNRCFYEKLGYKKVWENRQSDILTLIEYKKDLL